MEPFASCWNANISSTDITLSADKKTAYRTSMAAGAWATALSTPSGTKNIYVEVTTHPINNMHIGVCNINAPTNNYLGATPNGLSFSNNGNVYNNGIALTPAPGFNFNPGDMLAVAIYGQLQLIKFRNITQNSSWSPAYSLVSVGKPPYLLGVSIDNAAGIGSCYANFYGPFTAALPTMADIEPLQSPLPAVAAPAFNIWNPEALSSEQPVKVIDFDAVLTDGSYTSSNINDLIAIPFSYVKWGAAVLDSQNNLVFTDAVIDDIPIFSIVLQVTGPANNWLWAAWDYGTPFVFDKVHIPTSTAVAVANIPIPPPPAPTTAPYVGQGHTLQIFSSCDVASVFTWSQGRVHGTEDVLVYGAVEPATWPPSAVGRSYIITPGTVNATFPAYTPLFPPPLVGQGGGAPPNFPPPTPPPIGTIPAGVLVGPAIAAAAVPPSIAGKALIIFTFGSATTPSASAAFPQGTTTYPSPPIVFSNIYTGGSTPVTPPSTASTPPMGGSYNTGGQWGPPIGPALPPVVPVSRPFMVATNGDPSDVVYAAPVSDNPEPNSNGEVYDDSDEENEDWVEETPHRTSSTPKPKRGRPRRK